jgi:hypothetical protein
VARNDVAGAWHLRVQDLASGLQVDGELLVTDAGVDIARGAN